MCNSAIEILPANISCVPAIVGNLPNCCEQATKRSCLLTETISAVRESARRKPPGSTREASSSELFEFGGHHRRVEEIQNFWQINSESEACGDGLDITTRSESDNGLHACIGINPDRWTARIAISRAGIAAGWVLRKYEPMIKQGLETANCLAAKAIRKDPGRGHRF